jgi:hypothetical protein
MSYLAQTVKIVAEHCGAEQAEEMLVRARAKAAAYPTQELAVAQCWTASSDDDVWTELWRDLASKHPELFGDLQEELSLEARGVSLAWLYVREQHPEQLQLGLPAIVEIDESQLEIVNDLFETVVRPHVTWRVSKDCVLYAYLVAHEWPCLSLFCESALREHTFMLHLEDFNLYKHLALHENIHAALTDFALGDYGTAFLTPLRAIVNEAVVELLTRSIIALTSSKAAAWDTELLTGSYQLQVVALLSVKRTLRPKEMEFYIPFLVSLGLTTLRADHDDEVADALNSTILPMERSPAEWLAYFNDRSQTRRVERSDGSREWYRDGELHRTNGPAVKRSDGSREWYRDGELHRTNGPAVELDDGTLQWWRHGLLHREDGPAIESADGTREWYRHGLLDRVDGPAIESADGDRQWWHDGKRMP